MKSSAIRIVLITALVSSAVTVLLLRWNFAPSYRKGEEPLEFESVVAAAPEREESMSPDEEVNIEVYNAISPGVVNITSIVVEYNFFFSPIAKPGTGSGSILDQDGNVVTNYHVIEDAKRLDVTLPDQSKFRARVVGFDRQNDIAVIRLVGAPKEKLQPVPLGDSSQLKVGQKVLAIGNPFRLQNTLTVGIISAIGRTIQTDTGNVIENVIQTDAAINQGNSGGPLLNTKGEMIGINTSIVSPSGGNVGIGFAIPAATVRRIAADLIRYGRVLRPSLGIDGYNITEGLASALDLPVTSGVLVARAYRGGSAANAGILGFQEIVFLYNERVLAGGDIIVQIDDKPVASMDDINLALESKRPGETAEIIVYRGSQTMQKSVLLRERPRPSRF